MSGISTHVLDLSLGKPVVGLMVRLERGSGESALVLATEFTDENGRCRYGGANQPLGPDVYRLVFNTGQYFGELKISSIYPEISIAFNISEKGGSYHLPLLLSPNGFTTYRGS